MNKELFIALQDRLKEQVPALRWVDAEMGQLNVVPRPPVAFPCCLVDMRYLQCRSLTAGAQRVAAQFTLRVAFQGCGSSCSEAPTSVRERALEHMDTLEEIHRALQWWSFGRRINPLQRVSVVPERRSDNLKVYTMVYDTEFQEGR
ncbi:hypothetical protein [uncultured Alistipes sp.]|uniref:hypothetical protein n=1 Tax=uncultured Alistipes sp. TaxID=538949 RepID=UPI0025F55AA1|nr:hypothetical protein [uncultured Alistipes sp.]